MDEQRGRKRQTERLKDRQAEHMCVFMRRRKERGREREGDEEEEGGKERERGRERERERESE